MNGARRILAVARHAGDWERLAVDDIARVTLRGYGLARAWIRAHPSFSLAVAGFVAAVVTVVSGAPIGPPPSVIPLTRWFGLLSRGPVSRGPHGAVMIVGIVALIALWIVAMRLHMGGRTGERTIWLIGGAWATPFILGPPLLSNDVWTYAAQGLMLRSGLDPYRVGPSALGTGRAVAAVDPSWRSVPSPYGPLASTAQHLAIAISGGNPLGAALVFRGLAVVSLVGMGLLAAELAGPRRRVPALAITILNPLLLLDVVSAAHLDGLMCVILLGAVVAANQRRWAVAIILGVAAGAVKAPAFVAVPAIIAVHLYARRGRALWQALARDIGVAAGAVVGTSLLVRNGWGWVHALNTPAIGHTALAPASLIGDILRPVVSVASFDDVSAAGRITTLAAAACIVVYLTATAHTRALDRTVGYGILAVAILSPVVYPWYLIGGVACLAPNARGGRRDWIILISAVGCLLYPSGFTAYVSTTLSAIALGIALCVIIPRVLARYRMAQTEPVRPRVTVG